MRRSLAGPVLVAAAMACPVHSAAQPAAKVSLVGILSPGSSTESPSVQREPFERGLRELGWVPGVSIVIEYRYAEGRAARLGELATELVNLKVDVIVARSNPGVSAARQATGSIPIVMSSGNDPVAAGHVKSLARPGGNITGIANLVSELEAKRLELLKSAIPSLMRVGVLDNATFRRSDAALDDAGRALGVEIKSFAIARRESLAETFAAMSRARVGAVLLQADPFVLEPNRAQIVALAARHRLPGMYPWRFYVESGGLMFELVVNLKTARAIELTIPPGFLLRADEVIE